MRVCRKLAGEDFELSYKAVLEIYKRKNIPIYSYIRDSRYSEDFFRCTSEEDAEGAERLCYSAVDLGERVHGSFSVIFHNEVFSRDDKDLCDVVQEFGTLASLPGCQLEVIEIPDGVLFEVINDDYTGREIVRELSREW